MGVSASIRQQIFIFEKKISLLSLSLSRKGAINGRVGLKASGKMNHKRFSSRR